MTTVGGGRRCDMMKTGGERGLNNEGHGGHDKFELLEYCISAYQEKIWCSVPLIDTIAVTEAPSPSLIRIHHFL